MKNIRAWIFLCQIVGAIVIYISICYYLEITPFFNKVVVDYGDTLESKISFLGGKGSYVFITFNALMFFLGTNNFRKASINRYDIIYVLILLFTLISMMMLLIHYILFDLIEVSVHATKHDFYDAINKTNHLGSVLGYGLIFIECIFMFQVAREFETPLIENSERLTNVQPRVK